MVSELEICPTQHFCEWIFSHTITGHTPHSFVVFHCNLDKIFELLCQNETNRTRLKTSAEEKENQHQYGYQRKFIFVAHVFSQFYRNNVQPLITLSILRMVLPYTAIFIMVNTLWK